ncbi:MAG: hypothetical protein HMLKMBBP_00291 [Planctomycetes bacterium]|nr:hypothetical protein [Planctomycetota bacterium]
MPAHKNVVVGLDLSNADLRVDEGPLSPASRAAFDSAVWVAKAQGAKLHVLTSLDVDPAAAAMVAAEEKAGRATLRTRAAKRVAAAAAAAKSAGVKRTTSAAVIGGPSAALLDDVSRNARDLVVTGTRERGEAARNLLGSTTLQLVRRAAADSWIARASFGKKGSRVVCAIDLGDMAPHVLAAAVRIAAAVEGPLHVVHVVNLAAEDVLRAGAADTAIVQAYRAERRERALREIPKLVARLTKKGPKAKLHMHDGDTAPVILRAAAEQKADLVVLGSVVHGAAAALLGIGRTAERLLAEAPCSVLVVKPR